MNRLTIITVALLGWLIAVPAISADISSPPGVELTSPPEPQNLPTVASPSAAHPAVKELLAGMAERERALDLAAQLDELDLEELLVWEQIIPKLPSAALAPGAREQENAMRLGAPYCRVESDSDGERDMVIG